MILGTRNLLLLLVVFNFHSCKYSLSGYEIKAKTATIDYFQNQAPIQSADLSQVFTTKLEQKIIRDTPLRLVNTGGEITFSGAITGYNIRPIAVRGTETTAQSQLTLTVQIVYENSEDEEKNFRQSFSASEQFNAETDLLSIEDQLLDKITDQLVDNIFNRAFINW